MSPKPTDKDQGDSTQGIVTGCYECGKCGAEDCKLWRVMSTFDVELICWRCLEEKGHEIKLNQTPRGDDQVYDREIEGWSYGPAVPDLRGNFWGYTSVPQWWVEWWNALPDKKDDCKYCLGTGDLAADVKCMFCKGSGDRAASSR